MPAPAGICLLMKMTDRRRIAELKVVHDGQLDRLLALLDPLFRRPPFVVEAHHRPAEPPYAPAVRRYAGKIAALPSPVG
jgi:hypothetical protein